MSVESWEASGASSDGEVHHNFTELSILSALLVPAG